MPCYSCYACYFKRIPREILERGFKSESKRYDFMVAIGFNFVGFDIPFYTSLFIAVVLACYRRFRISAQSLFDYFVVFVTITVVSVVLFLVAPDQKSLSIPQEWSL